MYNGRTRPKHGRVHILRVRDGPSTWPCSGYVQPCTRPVHGRERPCTRAVNTYRVDGHVHGRVLCTRPCLRPAHGRVPTYTRPHMTRTRPCTRPVHAVNTAVYGPCTGPCPPHKAVFMARVHVGAVNTAVFGSCIRTRTVYTAVFTDRVYGPCTRPFAAVYAAGTRPYMTRTWPCTRPVHGRVHDMDTAVILLK